MRKKAMLIVMALILLAFAASAQQDERAQDILSGMTLEEKVAQLYLTRCPETGAQDVVEKYQPGGYVLFARDFEGLSADEIRNKIDAWQRASKIPMLIGVDEEGGTVTRVSRYAALREEKFMSPRALYDQGGIPAIVDDAIEKSRFLSDLHINFNLAPVADIARNQEDFMYSRSLGQDAPTTSLYVASVVKAMNEEGMASALKHFPGYGDNKDTHTGIAIDKRDYETFVQQDFQPFLAGIKAGAGCIMVSHNIVNCIDKEKPATLSREMHRILREELGFEGVIMTDDLYMGAIQDYTDAQSAAVAAVEAGNDLLCCTDFETQYQAVLEAVKQGKISRERIDESVLRILKWKLSLGIMK